MTLIQPFVWEHIFIPILPFSLLNYIAAPMPFVIGIKSSFMSHIDARCVSEVICVDLDKDAVEGNFNLNKKHFLPTFLRKN
eukprot:UN26420